MSRKKTGSARTQGKPKEELRANIRQTMRRNSEDSEELDFEELFQKEKEKRKTEAAARDNSLDPLKGLSGFKENREARSKLRVKQGKKERREIKETEIMNRAMSIINQAEIRHSIKHLNEKYPSSSSKHFGSMSPTHQDVSARKFKHQNSSLLGKQENKQRKSYDLHKRNTEKHQRESRDEPNQRRFGGFRNFNDYRKHVNQAACEKEQQHQLNEKNKRNGIWRKPEEYESGFNPSEFKEGLHEMRSAFGVGSRLLGGDFEREEKIFRKIGTSLLERVHENMREKEIMNQEVKGASDQREKLLDSSFEDD